MRQISIIGATFIGNRGAEAMLTTTIAELKKNNPDLFFNVFSYYPKKDSLLVDDTKIKVFPSTPIKLVAVLFPLSILYRLFKVIHFDFLFSFFPQSIRSLDQSDMLLDLAGVSFIDSRLKYLPFNVLSIWPAMILQTPVVKMAQAMGPFNKPINEHIAKYFLSRCLKIFARGKKTYEHLQHLGLSEPKIELSSDLALLQKDGYSLSKENLKYFESFIAQLKLKSNKNKLIGICPSSVVYKLEQKEGNGHYLESLISISKKLIENNYLIVFFPNATMPNNFSKFRNNDLAVINEIKKNLENKYSNKVFFVDRCINTDQIKKIIALCEITIVSRFHAMIASLTLSIPTFVLGWSHKYHEIMKEFEQEDLVIDYSKISLNKLLYILGLKNTKGMLHEVKSRKLLINKNLNKMKKISQKQISFIESELK